MKKNSSSTTVHSSEIWDVRSKWLSREMLQNLLYFIYTKTQSSFSFFQFVFLYFFPNKCPGLHRIRAFVRGSMKWKMQPKFSYTYLYKIWQILKRFDGTFHWAQTLKLGGVVMSLQSIFKSAEVEVFLNLRLFRCYQGIFR